MQEFGDSYGCAGLVKVKVKGEGGGVRHAYDSCRELCMKTPAHERSQISLTCVPRPWPACPFFGCRTTLV